MATNSSEAVRSVLQATGLFGGLDASALRSLEAGITQIQISPGEILLRQGDLGERLFVVVQGRLAVVLDSKGQPEQTLAELGPGDVVGEIALLTGGRRSATIRGLERSQLVGVSSDALRRLLEAEPDTLASLVDRIRHRLNATQLTVHLAQLLGRVEPSELRELEAEAEWVRLRSGAMLFREGEPADAAFIVISGRLRVVLENAAGERVVSELGRGEPVGEMALLDTSVRSASVYAIRDSDLAKISQATFDRMIEKHPNAAKRMASLVVRRLRAQLSGAAPSGSAINTIAVVPARAGIRVAEFTRVLVKCLGARGSVCHLTRREVDAALGKPSSASAPGSDPVGIRVSHWLGEQEAAHRFVVYEADAEDTPWRDRVLGQADHVLIVADAAADPQPGPIEAHLTARWHGPRAPRCSLLLVADEGAGERSHTGRWLRNRSVDSHHHLHRGAPADFERLARVLAGQAVGLVLGGGGARAFAHIGVLRALEEVGVPVDLVGGTSMGAIIAAARAMGTSSDETLELCRRHFVSIFDPTFPVVSLLAGRRVGAQLRAAFGEREIEDLAIPFFCVSTNLTRAEETVHRTGPLAAAVRASISLPGILPPVVAQGDLLVDGALVNNVPMGLMAATNGGGPVVSVDVSPEVDLGASHGMEPGVSGWKLLWDRVRPRRRSLPPPHILKILMRTTVIASTLNGRRRPLDGLPNLALKIPVGDWGLLEFSALDAIARRGYEASIDPIRAWWEERGKTADTISPPLLQPGGPPGTGG